MARNPKYTYNPCDDCKYSFSYNNQECPICKMCELKYFSAEYVAQKSKIDRLERICNSYALQYGTVKDQQAVIDKAKADAAKEIFDELEREIEDALKNNYEALRRFEDSDDLWHNVNGKINTLRGLEHFIGELKKKFEGKYGGSQ